MTPFTRPLRRKVGVGCQRKDAGRHATGRPLRAALGLPCPHYKRHTQSRRHTQTPPSILARADARNAKRAARLAQRAQLLPFLPRERDNRVLGASAPASHRVSKRTALGRLVRRRDPACWPSTTHPPSYSRTSPSWMLRRQAVVGFSNAVGDLRPRGRATHWKMEGKPRSGNRAASARWADPSTLATCTLPGAAFEPGHGANGPRGRGRRRAGWRAATHRPTPSPQPRRSAPGACNGCTRVHSWVVRPGWAGRVYRGRDFARRATHNSTSHGPSATRWSKSSAVSSTTALPSSDAAPTTKSPASSTSAAPRIRGQQVASNSPAPSPLYRSERSHHVV